MDKTEKNRRGLDDRHDGRPASATGLRQDLPADDTGTGADEHLYPIPEEQPLGSDQAEQGRRDHGGQYGSR